MANKQKSNPDDVIAKMSYEEKAKLVAYYDLTQAEIAASGENDATWRNKIRRDPRYPKIKRLVDITLSLASEVGKAKDFAKLSAEQVANKMGVSEAVVLGIMDGRMWEQCSINRTLQLIVDYFDACGLEVVITTRIK